MTALPAASVVQPAPAPTAVASKVPDGVSGAQAFKDAVTQQSDAVGGLIAALDAFGFTVGDTRISAWSVLVVVVVIVGLFLFARIGSKIAHRMFKRFTALDAGARVLGEKLLSILIWTFAILVGTDILGIDLTALTVFSGAFGLAVGFGMQKTIGNLIAGIILLMDRSIKPGDVISVADAAGQESFGQIRRIGIRAISVVTRDKTEYLIPNETLMINQVVNWSYSSKDVRVKAPVGVSYDTDLDLAEKLMLEAAKDTPRVLDFPEAKVLLIGFGESSVNLELRFWIDDPEDGLSNIRSDVLKRVWKLFHENNISIPFPQRDLHLKNNEQFERLVAAIGGQQGKRKGP